jgi:hypothetical protein
VKSGTVNIHCRMPDLPVSGATFDYWPYNTRVRYFVNKYLCGAVGLYLRRMLKRAWGFAIVMLYRCTKMHKQPLTKESSGSTPPLCIGHILNCRLLIASTFRSSELWRYASVVRICECPMRLWTAFRSFPLSSRVVAKVWRITWG